MNRIILNIQLHELLQNPKSQHNFDTCTSQPDIGKKKTKPKQNRGIKKDDANKILENNITVKLAISHKTKRWGEFAYFTWYKSTH